MITRSNFCLATLTLAHGRATTGTDVSRENEGRGTRNRPCIFFAFARLLSSAPCRPVSMACC